MNDFNLIGYTKRELKYAEKILHYGWKIVAQKWKEYRAMSEQSDSDYAYIRGMEDLLIALENTEKVAFPLSFPNTESASSTTYNEEARE